MDKCIDTHPFPNIGNSPFYNEFHVANMLPMMGSTKGFNSKLSNKEIEDVIDDDNQEISKKDGSVDLISEMYNDIFGKSHINTNSNNYREFTEKQSSMNISNTTHSTVIKLISNDLNSIKNIAKKVKDETKKYESSGPAGNQNCQLCTWSMEMQFRGENILPRPVYSPRDKIFDLNGCDIIKNPQKIKVLNKMDVKNKVLNSGNGSRFYTHVNWKNSSSGHEFILININGEVYVIDGQVGGVYLFNSKEGSHYFNDINYDNSFLVRMDNKPINKDTLKYNDKKYLQTWDDKLDTEYINNQSNHSQKK